MTEKTRPSVLERRYEEIAVLTAKLEANRALMSDFATLLEHELNEARQSFEMAANGEPIPA